MVLASGFLCLEFCHQNWLRRFERKLFFLKLEGADCWHLIFLSADWSLNAVLDFSCTFFLTSLSLAEWQKVFCHIPLLAVLFHCRKMQTFKRSLFPLPLCSKNCERSRVKLQNMDKGLEYFLGKNFKNVFNGSFQWKKHKLRLWHCLPLPRCWGVSPSCALHTPTTVQITDPLQLKWKCPSRDFQHLSFPSAGQCCFGWRVGVAQSRWEALRMLQSAGCC